MSNGFVADSSVGVAWAVLSQSTDATDRLLNDVASGTPFVVPVLWMFEVANALLALSRRKRIEPEQCARARRAISRLTPLIDEKGPQLAWSRIWDLADRHALSVYDAVYLELADRRGLPLATRDAELSKAAKLSGVPTLLQPG
jgi:predicted nucleic acid-binding protein